MTADLAVEFNSCSSVLDEAPPSGTAIPLVLGLSLCKVGWPYLFNRFFLCQGRTCGKGHTTVRVGVSLTDFLSAAEQQLVGN